MTQDEIQSKTIIWLRFPLMVAVVFVHNFGVPYDVDLSIIDYCDLSNMDAYNILRTLFSYIITKIRLPMFFLFSGFLFFYKVEEWNKSVYSTKIRRRITSLIVPFLLWNIIAFLLVFFEQIIQYLTKGSGISLIGEVQEKGLLAIFWDWYPLWPEVAPFYLPFWFMKDLIIVSVLSPLVYLFVKYFKHYGLIIMLIICCQNIWVVDLNIIRFDAILFFSLGAYLSLFNKNIVTECSKLCMPAMILTPMLLLLSIYYYTENYLWLRYSFTILAGICVINIVASIVRKHDLSGVKFLSQTSFFIYAVHDLIVLQILSNITFNTMPFNKDSICFLYFRYFTEPFLIVGICLFLYLCMNRFFPKQLNVLMGRRIVSSK